jgi:hypothetical protein
VRVTTVSAIEQAIWRCFEADALYDWGGCAPYVIIERGPHYVQAALACDEPPYLEVVSNRFLEREARLLPTMEAALLAYGWNAPSGPPCDERCAYESKPDHHPNYWKYLPDSATVAEIAEVLVTTATRTFVTPLHRFVLKTHPTEEEWRELEDGD